MRFQLFLPRTISTGDHRTFSPDGASPDIPESLSGDINGLSSAGYHDPLQLAPWMLGIQQQAQQPMQSNTGIRAFPLSTVG